MSSNGTDKEQSAYRFTAHLGAAVWTCRSANPSAGVTSGAPTFLGRQFSSAKPLSGVTSGAPTFPGRRFGSVNRLAGVPIGWRASQVAPLRFPGGGLSIVGATFMSPGWQAGICGTAAVWFRQIGWRAYQTVGGRANRLTGVTSGAPTSPGRRFGSVNRLAGVTSGAPTFPGRRFINRRGDIHVARVAGGNMQDRGGLFRQSSAGVSNRWRAYQTVYGRHKWRPYVSRAAVWFRPIGWRASQVAPLRFPGGSLVPPNRLTGVTSGAPAFPGRRFVNRRGDIHVARMAGGNMRERWIETSARGRQEYIK